MLVVPIVTHRLASLTGSFPHHEPAAIRRVGATGQAPGRCVIIIDNRSRPIAMMPADSMDCLSLCRNCRHYYITHDARFGHGCRAFGFKSVRPPMQEIFAASGLPCQYFEPKAIASDPQRTGG
jgi:hypothetical protein